MSLLYKEKKDVIYKADIIDRNREEEVEIHFFADCGKFGTDEMLDSYSIKPEELLEILQNHYDQQF